MAPTAAILWMILAGGLGLGAGRRRRWVIFALVASGIPVLGLVTRDFGPVFGLVSLALGVLLLWVLFGRGETRPPAE